MYITLFILNRIDIGIQKNVLLRPPSITIALARAPLLQHSWREINLKLGNALEKKIDTWRIMYSGDS